MNSIDRETHFQIGPRFFRSADGLDMFEHRIDSRNLIGPRVATKRDKELNDKLWAEYLAEQTVALDQELKPKRGPGRPRKDAE